MSEKKHIDRLFQEKFKDFETKPSANVWAGIQGKMNLPQEKTKAGLPIWFYFASIAASLVLFFTVGNLVFNNEKTNTPIIVDIENTNKASNTEDIIINNTVTTEIKNTSESENNNQVSNEKKSINNTAIVINKNNPKNNNTEDSSEKNNVNTTNNLKRYVQSNSTNNLSNNLSNSIPTKNTITNNEGTATKNTILNSTSSKNTIANNNNVTNNSKEKNIKAPDALDNNNATSNTTVATTNSEKEKEEEKKVEIDSANSSNTIEEALAKIEDFDEKEENVNRWSASANAAPVYYNTLGKGSHFDDQFINNQKNGEINTSYGINIGYALNNKLKLRSGINKLNLSYDTASVIIYENVANTPDSYPLRNIKFSPTGPGQNISVLSTNSLFVQQINDIINDNLNTALSQRLSYLEVPLELEYAVVKNRFGLNLIGGFSTFILNDNEVVTEVKNRKTKIGEANNINSVSFSANAGIGIDYKFSNAIKFSLEPTFKYQINAYNETSGDFRPYIIGVYTGISYKF